MRPACAIAALLAAPALLAGQAAAPGPRPARQQWTSQADTLEGRSWLHPLASLLIPGSGQLLAGADRGAVYLAVEGYLITRALDARSEASAAERRYQDLAWEVARHRFAAVRRDTGFVYYETMERWVESGAYDQDPGEGFLPEDDPTTFNGATWELARQTFFMNPDSTPDQSSEAYQRAVAFYRARAVGHDFRWSWRDAALEHDLFREQIRASDEAYRTASLVVGFVIANHLAAVVDAFVSQRLTDAAGRSVTVHSVLLPERQLVGFGVAF